MAVNQWKVTEDGLESIGQQSENFIEMERISQRTIRDGIEYYDWPLHMAIKSWVDIEDFIIAFERALEAWEDKEGEPINQEMLEKSYIKARELAGLRPHRPSKVLPD